MHDVHLTTAMKALPVPRSRPAANPSSTPGGNHGRGGGAMVTMLLRVFNAWTWIAILVSPAIAYRAWEHPSKLLSGLFIAAVVWFALDRVINRSERAIAAAWNEPT